MDMDMDAEKAKFAGFGIGTPEFTFAGMETWARVVSVYDGDTVTLVFPMATGMNKFSARLFGIDTCEMKSKEVNNRALAIRARNRLLELITGRAIAGEAPLSKKEIVQLLSEDVYIVWIECMEFDKYGRILLRMYSGPDKKDKSFSDVLVDEKLAYQYFGETKLSESDQTHCLS